MSEKHVLAVPRSGVQNSRFLETTSVFLGSWRNRWFSMTLADWFVQHTMMIHFAEACAELICKQNDRTGIIGFSLQLSLFDLFLS